MTNSSVKLGTLVLLVGCGSAVDSVDGDAGIGSVGSVTTDAGAGCATLTTQQARVACAANAVLASLPSSQVSSVSFALTDYVTRSKWNNLPVSLRPRAGAQMSSLSSTSQAAVLDLMTIALNSAGQSTLTGILRSDDYLATMAGGYGSSLYSVAIFGTPSDTGNFEVMFGGHHMAYNLNFVDGGFYPAPQHLGAEPKAEFTYNGATYSPMAPKGDAMFALYDALTSSQKSEAYLSGQSFSDVIVSPDLDYGKGSSRTSVSAYPTGANRKGVLVSNLDTSQQALVVAAAEQWVRQYPSEVADQLMAEYTSAAAFADTYVAWGGNSSGPSKDVSGSYLRIDGPRLWIELAVQGGVIIRTSTHYHSIYHDKTRDYGGEF